MELDIDSLRKLRSIANELSHFVMDDLSPYVHKRDNRTFVRLPDSKHDTNDVGVTVSCSCLMGLALTGNLKDFHEKTLDKAWDAKESFKLVVETQIWSSSGLLKMNAFTSTLVLRAFGFLVEKELLSTGDAVSWVHKGQQEMRDQAGHAVPATAKAEWSLLEVFMELGKAVPKGLAVEKYPTSAAVVYWFIDAIQRSKLNANFNKTFWEDISSWVAKEFWKQQSLIVAENDALMDPIAMAMAACVCKKLKGLADLNKKQSNAEYLYLLPSESELDFSIKLLFSKQAGSGIWPKYFPLFHYPDVGGNFCFTFEMLEALLNEFGKDDEVRLLEIDGAFAGLSRALNWCKRNRFEFQNDALTYTGWNSGGQLSSLTAGKPESWATAVVHMFLWELEDALSRKLEQKILTNYKAIKFKPDPLAMSGFADIEIVTKRTSTRLKELILEHLINPAQKDFSDLRRKGLVTGKVSALLFGPPGTSKTELCVAIAKQLGWPLVQIDPSHFLEGGLESISVRADKIFIDLLDLNGVVVLFDEMDPLVQTRDDEELRLDITSQFLTTSMLPKLTKLHERKRVMFFMATNFQNRFDPAIKRAGRFDLLLCMGPPCLESKLRDLRLFLKKDTVPDEVDASIQLLRKYTSGDPELAQMLELFLFGELKTFLKEYSKGKALSDELRTADATVFKTQVGIASEFNYLRLKDLKLVMDKLGVTSVKELESNQDMNYDFLERNRLKLNPIVRYFADKMQSKVQA